MKNVKLHVHSMVPNTLSNFKLSPKKTGDQKYP